jgi:ABC-2 type transport system ATP-binding protein
MLEVTELVKRYGEVKALDGFTLTARPGEIVGLVGHNGAGKTTFTEVVSGLVRPEAGRVVVDGISDPRRARSRLGVAPQRLALYPGATVRETLWLFGGLAGLRRRALGRAIDEIADALRLTGFLGRRVGLLSGGQQRRTQAATAMLHRPAVLLLDEPTVGADPETRHALLEVVKARAAEGAAVVYTTHYLPELAELQATIAVARQGRIVARGTSAELLSGLPGEVRLRLHDGEIRRSTTDPTRTLAGLLRELDSGHRVVQEIDLRTPSLDDLYHALAVDDAA